MDGTIPYASLSVEVAEDASGATSAGSALIPMVLEARDACQIPIDDIEILDRRKVFGVAASDLDEAAQEALEGGNCSYFRRMLNIPEPAVLKTPHPPCPACWVCDDDGKPEVYTCVFPPGTDGTSSATAQMVFEGG